MTARFFIILLSAIASASAAYAEVVTETIIFVSEDGRSYMQYQGNRTSGSSYDVYFDKGGALDKHLYFFPNTYTWDRKTNPKKDLLKIQQGDYSYIKNGKFEDRIKIAANGDFVFDSAHGEDPDDKYYGIWNTPENMTKLVYAWVLPANLEIVDAKSNSDGEWVRRGNTITWFGEDVNNVAFKMRYRAKTAGTYRALNKAIGKTAGVTIDQVDRGVRLTLADTILFPSGSAELSVNGKAVVAKLASAINFGGGLNAVVEGHTDNVPVKGALKEKFASNWELSAARALAVVRTFETAGAPAQRLEARAYGEHRPAESNASTEGRTANRRISILVSTNQ